MPSASETIAMAVTKGVLKSVRMANLRLRTRRWTSQPTAAFADSGVTRRVVADVPQALQRCPHYSATMVRCPNAIRTARMCRVRKGRSGMARLVFGMNQSLAGYANHMAFAPSPTLFRHFIEEAQ